MKLNSHNLRSRRAPAAPENGAAPRAAAVPAQRGIALVITLVMLSVTLVMAVAFLALARRERNSVSTATDTTTAKLAADSALAAAQAQIMANVLSAPDGTFNFGLLISTNFINPLGFNPTSSNPTNVNYNYYLTTPGPLSQADIIQNIANLKYSPRVPVFIQTNPGAPLDFRFYLDLNRNGQFDDTGTNLPNILEDGTTNGFGVTQTGDPQWVGILARPDATHSPNNLFLSRYAFIAIPIGNGLDINAIHNQPYPQNQPLNSDFQTYGRSAYLRNEGVGSWEINLAAFLADLNTNQWDVVGAGNDYRYLEAQVIPNPNTGAAFEDALSILSHRYNYSYNYLYPLSSLFGSNGVPLQDQPFDLNPTRPLLTGTPVLYYANQAANPWAGSDNTNRYYDLPSELFNPTVTSPDFVKRLSNAGTENGAANPSTYDRYTFYRMLAQMGTDSDPDDGKMNLNYRNVDTNGVVVPGMETNCIVWSPLEFFTSAADRMLRLYSTNWFFANPSNFLASYYGITGNYFNPGGNYNYYYYTNASGNFFAFDPTGFGLTNASGSAYLGWTNHVPAFGITNIPVYVNGQFVYSPAVNRVLQLAANLYDASTTNFYPSVFRPLFEHDRLFNVFIVGFTNLQNRAFTNTVNGLGDFQLSTPFDISSITNYLGANRLMITNGVGINVYGVPWIIGAKKGFPAFNKFGMQTISQATRKLQIYRSTIPTVLNTTTFTTNQLIAFNIQNLLNVDCWNSYTNAYTNEVAIQAYDYLSMEISNSVAGAPPNSFNNFLTGSRTFINAWPGYNPPNFTALSFTNLFSTSVPLLTNDDFYFGLNSFGARGFYPDSFRYGWESNNFNLTFPEFTLFATNRLQLYMLDMSTPTSGYHVIDYVQLGGPATAVDLTAAIETNNPAQVGYGPNMWSKAPNSSGIPYGIISQITVSESPITSFNGNGYWLGGAANLNNQANVEGFSVFMGLTPGPYPSSASPNNPAFGAYQTYATNYMAQVPYTPTVTVSDYTAWQVNDPLVHYLASDLTFNGTEKNGVQTGLQLSYNGIGNNPQPQYPSFNVVNDRYQPWSMSYTNNLPAAGPNAIVPTAFALAVKDPLVWSSDYWGFPTNLYPTVGWIGRVHRGTPWQTVYLKAHDVLHVLDRYPNGDPGSGTNTWVAWTSDYNTFDAANSAPVQDRLLFDLFTSRPNDNAVRGTLSVNQTNLAAWSAVLSGMVVLTNTTRLPNFNTTYNGTPVQYSSLIVQPAAVDGTLQTILTNIDFARSGTNLAYGFTNFDRLTNAFEHVGDILATPALTESSPYLNITANQQKYGISDATYEWLPQQMMGLVRGSSTPRYVIYCYGQALRPAVNGLVSGANNFGLVTNYQVVAESAVRAVVSVHAQLNTSGAFPVTNYTTRVESYNVLPSQ
jgi:hypothetical protein